MKLNEIEKLVDFAKEKGLSRLSVTEESGRSISFSFSEDESSIRRISSAAGTVLGTAPTSPAPSQTSTVAPTTVPGVVEVRAPFVGTFYTAAAPGEADFVKVGDKVKRGQVLCILEAMKIMNEIESSADGVIVSVDAPNESYVEYDQVLFSIKPN